MLKRHIVLTTRQFAPCIGGTETSVLELATRLVQQGHEVSVITLNRNIWTGETLAPFDLLDGIAVYRVPYLNLGLRPVAVCNPGWLFGLLKSADIIHNHDIRFLFESCLLAKFWFGTPLVIGSHGFILHQKKLGWLKRAVFRFYYLPLFRFIDCLQAVSLQDFARVEKALPPEMRVLIPGGVDAARFSGHERAPQSGRLLYFGRIDTHKGLDLLFEVLAKLPGTSTLRLVYGSAREECRRALVSQAERLGIEARLEWVGKLEHAALCEEIALAQVVLFPSRYEGFGLTTLEAMAAGAVVVANQIEAFRNIIDDGTTGFLVDFENPATASTQLDAILNKSVPELEAVGTAAAQAALKQDWSQRAEEVAELYAELIRRKRHKKIALPTT